MKRARALLGDFGWCAIGLLCTADSILEGQVLTTLVWSAVTVVHLALAHSIHQQRKDHAHGHREPRRGHRDRAAGQGRTDPAGGTIAGLFPPGAVRAGQGAGPPVVAFNRGGNIQRLAVTKVSFTPSRTMPGSDWYRSRGALSDPDTIPGRESAETIRAWKRAGLDVIVDGGTARPVLIGPVTGRLLLVDYGTADCYPVMPLPIDAHAHNEPAPRVDCTCGFYAVTDRAALDGPLEGGTATLEVELFGRVIRHERGYRAQRQRVLSVTLDRTCHICLDATGTVVGVGINRTVAELLAIGPTWCGTLCPDCLSIHEPLCSFAFTPAELAGALQTEVRWAAAA